MLISYSPEQAEALSSLPCLFQQPPWDCCRGVVHWEGGLPRAAALFPFVPFQKRTALCLFGEEGAHFAPLIAAALEQASGLGLRLVTTDLSYGSHPLPKRGTCPLVHHPTYGLRRGAFAWASFPYSL
mgnify:CR=1 FL=1